MISAQNALRPGFLRIKVMSRDVMLALRSRIRRPTQINQEGPPALVRIVLAKRESVKIVITKVR